MTTYKPTKKLEKRYRFEMVIELIIVFFIFSVIALLLPPFLGVENRSLIYNDSFLNFMDYFYNEHHFYPYVESAGLIGTFIYWMFQIRKQRVVGFCFEENIIKLTCRNSFTGKITEINILKSNFKVQKIHDLYRKLRFEIYDNEKHSCTFYPKSAIWNSVYDDIETVVEIVDLLTENLPDEHVKLDQNISIKSKFDWNILNVIILLLVFIILLISMIDGIQIFYFILFISICLFLEYAILRSIVISSFTLDKIDVFLPFRFKSRRLKLKYSDISKISYCFPPRGSNLIRLYYIDKRGKTKKLECYFDEYEMYNRILKIFQKNGIAIEFHGIDKEQENFIMNELKLIEL